MKHPQDCKYFGNCIYSICPCDKWSIKEMTKEELEKYTVDFMNNETNSNRSKLNSIMGKMLIRYAEIFQKRIADLEKENAELKAFKEKCKFNASDICKEIETENNLTKAKQLLKRCYENHIYLEPLRSEIEQFLNGECCPDCLCEDCTKDCEIKKTWIGRGRK